jgi:hypothetical protein
VSINCFPDFKIYCKETLCCISEEFQPWIIFQQDGALHTGVLMFVGFFGCNISKQVDWERCSDTLATTIAGYHPSLTSFYEGYVKDKMLSTPVPDITQILRQE